MEQYFIIGVFAFGLTYGMAIDKKDSWLDCVANFFGSLLCGILWPLLWGYCIYVTLTKRKAKHGQQEKNG